MYIEVNNLITNLLTNKGMLIITALFFRYKIIKK